MRGIKALSSLEDVIVICAELKDMRHDPYEFHDKWTPEQLIAHKANMKHLDQLGFQLLADLLNSRKMTQKEYWAAYCGWYDCWNYDEPYWGNDAYCDFAEEDELYEKYSAAPPNLTISDFF